MKSDFLKVKRRFGFDDKPSVYVGAYSKYSKELDNFEEAYCGEWNREEDFARHIFHECKDLERSMGDLARYFDYEAFGRELFMYDYSISANNNVFRNI